MRGEILLFVELYFAIFFPLSKFQIAVVELVLIYSIKIIQWSLETTFFNPNFRKWAKKISRIGALKCKSFWVHKVCANPWNEDSYFLEPSKEEDDDDEDRLPENQKVALFFFIFRNEQIQLLYTYIKQATHPIGKKKKHMYCLETHIRLWMWLWESSRKIYLHLRA